MKNRRSILCVALLLPLTAQAANWLKIQGNERPNASQFRTFGFLQPTYTYIDANPIEGLTGGAAKFNGQLTIPNMVGPEHDSNENFHFMRAHAGARGLLTDNINYFFQVAGGRNAVTKKNHVMLLDASVTFNYIPGARIRAGLFKLPTSNEALTAVQVAYPYIYYSAAVKGLVSETPVAFDGGKFNRDGASTARFTNGGNGFRDWGVQVYDWVDRGPWEFSYAGMVSNGNNIASVNDNDSNKDLTLRFQTSYIFDGSKGPKREEISAYIWHQSGKRQFNGQNFDRVREGVGINYLKGPVHFSSEWVQGKGMIVAGPNPPFNGQPIEIAVNEKAHGWYLEGGWRFLPKWEADVRQDQYYRMTENAALERDFQTTTLGLQYFVNKSIHVTANYEWRKLSIPVPNSNAEKIADNLADLAALQLTWKF